MSRLLIPCSLLLPLLLLGCGATAPRRVYPIEPPVVYEGHVLEAAGPIATREGDSCSVEVWHTDSAVLSCRIRVRCGEDVIYGLPGAGYNRCMALGPELVYAVDQYGTRRDGDPRLLFDRVGGQVVVADDRPQVVVRVDLTGLPEAYRRPGAQRKRPLPRRRGSWGSVGW